MISLLLFLLSLFIPSSAEAVHPCNASNGTTTDCISSSVTLGSPEGRVTTTANGQTIENRRISTGAGTTLNQQPCILVLHSNVTIRNNDIGPCGTTGVIQNGIQISGGTSNTTIKNNYIHNATSSAIDGLRNSTGDPPVYSQTGAQSGVVYMNRFKDNRNDINTNTDGTGWTITHNITTTAKPTGNLVSQFAKTKGKQIDGSISCNRIDRSVAGVTYALDCSDKSPPGGPVGDLVSVHDHNGASGDELIIRGNIIRRDGSSQTSSVNINPADHLTNLDLQSWYIVDKNIMIERDLSACGGTTGMGGGHDVTFTNNLMTGKNGSGGTGGGLFNPPFEAKLQRTGANYGSVKATVCTPVTVSGNQAYMLGSNDAIVGDSVAEIESFYNKGTSSACPKPTNFDNNDWVVPSYTHSDGTVYNLTTTAGRDSLINANSLESTCNACSDGLDNDGDGLIDHSDAGGNETGCLSKWANKEDSPATVPTCTDAIDCFNRANENPLSSGGKWTNAVRGGSTTALAVESNKLASSGAAGTFSSAYWNAARFGPNLVNEIHYDTEDPGITTVTRQVQLFVRVNNPGSLMDGYGCFFRQEIPPDVDTVAIHKYVDNVDTIIAGPVSRALTNGDELRCRIEGDDIYAEIDVGNTGTWQTVTSVQDNTFLTDGFVGIELRDPIILDNFNAATLPLAACNDGIDNEATPDGKIDYPQDPGCTSKADTDEFDAPPPPAACADTVDNDNDTKTDYPTDPGCTSATDNDEFDSASAPKCSNTLDDDSDGLIDMADPGCTSTTDNDEFNPKEQCSDTLDNDSDGLTDYPNDPGCTSASDNDEFNVTPPQCNNNIDDDNDGLKDYPTDPGCTSITDNDEFNPPATQCSDGADNDGDGLKDYPNDPGCSSNQDNDESNAAPGPGTTQCSDTLDNDSDGKTDLADPGCSSAADNDEFNFRTRHQCSDTVDNDGDSKIDWPNDPGCASIIDNDEYNKTAIRLPQCSDSIDNDGDGLTDYPTDTGCTGTQDNDEYNPPTTRLPQCNDSTDNDGDGLYDYPSDPGCSSTTDNDEYNPRM